MWKSLRNRLLKGMLLGPEDVQVQLSRRRPGQSNLTTPVRPKFLYLCAE